MPKTSDDLFAFLAGLGITVKTTTHPPLYTVADSQLLRGELEGGHTKNLFLKDKKGRYFLLTVGEDSEIDLKSVHQRIGASGRLSFGRPEALMELLGVVPGAVSAFGVINDTGHAVKVVLDAELMHNAVINAHPLVNTATVSIGRDDLVKFLRATGHEPDILKLAE